MQLNFSLIVAAVVLNNFIVAQYIGLPLIKSLRETIGLGAVTIITLLVAALLDWLLTKFLLEPFAISYLRNFIAVILCAAIAPGTETILRKRHPSYFSINTTLPPLTITSSAIVLLALIYRTPQAGLFAMLFSALGYGVLFSFLLALFQALRERTDHAAIPPAMRGAALDMLSAAFVIVALSALFGLLPP
ncbi:MAG TPA: Rnf-Nqr domain containing protein [Spongiibacteraceae bacterium]|jgi:electron transport complex protein RnfA